jgi:hypothetical protein
MDEEGNYILLDVNNKGYHYTIGSVYCPNYDEQTHIYDQLVRDCKELGNTAIILGGDFNTTWDNSWVNSNVDVFNMINIPSMIRSEKVREMAGQLNLVEPFRFMYPNGVCAILLRLYTSTEHLKRVYTSPGPLLEIYYFK